jgi:hypothetical protein
VQARLFALLTLLSACAAEPAPHEAPPEVDLDEGDVASGATADTGTPQCSARITAIDPAADAQNMPRDVVVTVRFDSALHPTDPWWIGVRDNPGTARLSDDRTFATWTPDVPLAAGSEHHIVASVCGEELRQSFSTLPEQVTPEEIIGLAWNLDVGDVRWVAPAGAETLIPLLGLGAVQVEIGTDAEGAPALSVALEPAYADERHRAPLAFLGPLDLGANPCFDVGPVQARFAWGSGTLRVDELRVHAMIADDELSQVGFSGRIDAREVRGALGGLDLCVLSANIDPCVPCPDGVAACLEFIGAHEGSAP